MNLAPNLQEIQRTLQLLHAPGVVELRALNTSKGTWSGYYNNSAAMAKAAFDLSSLDTTPNTYHTLQDVHPDLFARRSNIVQPFMKNGDTTSDEYILRYRWLPLDADPKRASGISATDAEKALALEVIQKVRAFLVEHKMDSLLADSGNGYHLLVRIDLPADKKQLVKDLVAAFAKKFSTDTVGMDAKVFNPARIWKLYGTPARKGSNMSDRPWRLSKLMDVPEGIQNQPVSEEILRSLLAEMQPASATTVVAAVTPASANTITPEMVEAESARLGLEIGKRLDYHFTDDPQGQDGLKWQMTCPFNPEHKKPDAYLGLTAGGKFFYHCSHDSCDKNGTNAFIQKVDGFQFALSFGLALTQNKVTAPTVARLDYVLVFEDAEDVELAKGLGFNAVFHTEADIQAKYERIILMGSTKSVKLARLHSKIPGSLFCDFPQDYSKPKGGRKRHPSVPSLSDAKYPNRDEYLAEEDVEAFLNGVVGMEAVRKSSAHGHAECNKPMSNVVLGSMPDPLHEDAYCGIAGRHLRNIAHNSEAHPAGLLGLFLAGFGSIVGLNAHIRVEDNVHYPIINVLVTGKSSRSRKDTAMGRALRPLKDADMAWATDNVHQSFSSGESVVSYFHRLRKGNKACRLFVTDTEFKTTLNICGRDGNTLSEMYRHLFNADPMEVQVKKEKDLLYVPISCGSIGGLITLGELLDALKVVELESGFVNRYLTMLVHRVKKISRPRRVTDKAIVAERLAIVVALKEVLAWVEKHKEDFDEDGTKGLRMSWDEEAGRVWDDFYYGLADDDPSYLTRAEVFVMRLTMIYALLDMSHTMQLEHLKAALAVWRYAEQSGRLVYGSPQSPDVSRLLVKALAANGITRGAVYNFFNRHKNAEELDWIMEEAARISNGQLEVVMGLDKWKEPTVKGLKRVKAA